MVGTDISHNWLQHQGMNLNQKTKPFLNHCREVMDLTLTIVSFQLCGLIVVFI